MAAGDALATQLEELGVKGVLVRMARNGQILELKCEMPTCYCPKGPKHFDPWPKVRYAPERAWAPNADHYPTLKRDGGSLSRETSDSRMSRATTSTMAGGRGSERCWRRIRLSRSNRSLRF
jgi:hypothetical protein